MSAVEPIIDRYQVVRVIGEGGMGVVYEAIHMDERQRVALKVLTSRRKQKPDTVDRFRREATIAAQLTSMHVTKVLGAGTTGKGLPYIAMELLEGWDLAVELAQAPLSLTTAIDYVQQAALGIADAHRFGIVHRDIKPANIFICNVSANGRRLVKVLDFGISKMDDGNDITRTFDSFGTPQYMSPEQIRATKDVDARSDVWSLGIVLYEALSGRLPFDGPPTRVIAAVAMEPVPPLSLSGSREFPMGLESVVMKALEKDPEKRYQSALELVAALAPFGPKGRLEVASVPPKTLDQLVPPLGSLLIALGAIDAAQLRDALEIQQGQPDLQLGAILVKIGACSQATIEGAIESQRRLAASAARPPGRAQETAPELERERELVSGVLPVASPPPASVEASTVASAARPSQAAPPPASAPAAYSTEEPSEPRPHATTLMPHGVRGWTPVVLALVAGAVLAALAVAFLVPPRHKVPDLGQPAPASATTDR